jgi:hypothetical protein
MIYNLYDILHGSPIQTQLSRGQDLVTRANDRISRAHEINKNPHMSRLCHRMNQLDMVLSVEQEKVNQL